MNRRIVLGSMLAAVLLAVGGMWTAAALGNSFGGPIDGTSDAEWAASPVILPGGQQLAIGMTIEPGGVRVA